VLGASFTGPAVLSARGLCFITTLHIRKYNTTKVTKTIMKIRTRPTLKKAMYLVSFKLSMLPHWEPVILCSVI